MHGRRWFAVLRERCLCVKLLLSFPDESSAQHRSFADFVNVSFQSRDKRVRPLRKSFAVLRSVLDACQARFEPVLCVAGEGS